MAAQALRELQRLIGEYAERWPSWSLHQRVTALVEIQRALRRFARATVLPDIRAAKARILEYLRANVGRVVDTDELEVGAGIKVYARRIRDLRGEIGWPIVSGLKLAAMHDESEDLELDVGLPHGRRPDQYTLIEDRR